MRGPQMPHFSERQYKLLNCWLGTWVCPTASAETPALPGVPTLPHHSTKGNELCSAAGFHWAILILGNMMCQWKRGVWLECWSCELEENMARSLHTLVLATVGRGGLLRWIPVAGEHKNVPLWVVGWVAESTGKMYLHWDGAGTHVMVLGKESTKAWGDAHLLHLLFHLEIGWYERENGWL